MHAPRLISLTIAAAALALVGAPDLGAQTLVKDLGQGQLVGSPSSYPRPMTNVAGGVLLSVDQPGTGAEIWLTDGTVTGTTLVADVQPGYRGSSPGYSVALPSGGVVFTAETDGLGRELWLLTATGTQLLADINPGSASSNPLYLTLVGAEVLFFADDGATGRELWKTDGTSAGTVPVVDIVPGPASPWVGGMAVLGSNAVFFTADSATQVWELWWSDGTSAGTTMVVQNSNGPYGLPVPMATLGNRVLFRAWDAAAGIEPWVTDGTAQGTTRLADIAAGTRSSNPFYYYSGLALVIGNRAFFVGSASTGDEVWTSDGTAVGTTQVATAAALGAGNTATLIGPLANGDVVFSLTDGSFPYTQTLFSTDGTPAGTARIADLGSTRERDPYPGVLARGLLYFPGNGPEGNELWRTDGTAVGTVLVRDITPGAASSGPIGLIAVGNGVVFAADDGIHGCELWSSDGTAAGTTLIELAAAGINAGSSPGLLGTFEGRSYWMIYGGALPNEVWGSDGTTAGTRQVVNPQPLNGLAGGPWVEMDDFFAFVGFQHGTGSELWVSDGTGPGTRLVVDLYPGSRSSNTYDLVRFRGRVFFGADDGVNGRELFSSDGTAAGTVLVADVHPGSTGSNPTNLFVWKDQLFFLAEHPASGRELWVSDGTTGGTRLVADIRAGYWWGFHSPLFPPKGPVFAGLGDFVYFAADDGFEGRELWRSDGTAAGTTMVRNIHLHWLASSNPFGFAAVGGRVAFAAWDHNGLLLWATDGTQAGTVPVSVIPGTVVSSLQPLSDNEAMFWVDDGSNASHLWKTDGVWTGTNLVKTINAANVDWTTPVFGRPGETRLLFNANDGISGDELWVTDGTASGTVLLRDIAPTHSNPRSFVRVGNRVVFVASDGRFGAELHAIDMADTGDYAVDTYGSGCVGSTGVVPEISVTGAVSAAAAQPFAVEQAFSRALAAAALLVGTGRARLPLPTGCRLWTAPLLAVPTVTSASGSAAVRIVATPPLVGQLVHFQYVTLDPGGALLGQLSATRGLEIVGGL